MALSDLIPGLSTAKLVIAGVVFTALLSGVVMIYQAGQNSTEIDRLKDTVKAHETRDRIDAEVDGSSRFDRCIELGGLPDKCEQLRGMDAAPDRQ